MGIRKNTSPLPECPLSAMPVDSLQMLAALKDVETATDEDRMAQVADLRERLLGRGGHADRWMWLLIGPGQHGQIIEGVILPSIGKWLLRPGLEDDLQRFLEAFPTLAIGNAIPS